MRYVRANDIIPEELLKEIQKYIDGEYIYIPRKENLRKKWGENSLSKLETLSRNMEIYRDYCGGLSVNELADAYFLSEKSIRRILLEQRKNERL